MEKKKRNPNSQKLDPSKPWSELPKDLLNSVCERLGYADFQRAKSVCSTWYSTLRQSMSKLQIPWLLLLPNEHNKKYRCTLFNPEEDKLYTTQDLGLQFAMSDCLATYGTWLLMQYPLYRLYIVNPLTKETIYLPPVESQVGKIKIEVTFDDRFRIEVDHKKWEYDNINIKSPVFWIDDLTKDYVVLWGFDELCVVYAKKGDEKWKQIPGISNCFGMVYRDHKLYFASSTERKLKIFDLSGEIPQEMFQCGVTLSGYKLQPYNEISEISSRVVGIKLVVTITGDVLRVEKLFRWSEMWSFRIYKVYSRGVYKKEELIDSLGDEAMLFDLGITVPANDIGGFTRNSIYFTVSSYHTYSRRLKNRPNISEIRLFDLDTRKMEPVHKFDCLSAEQLKLARWIIPNFNRKCF